MKLKILLPFRVFIEEPAVLQVIAETPDGSFGLLPQRLDCVSVLTPGILTYQTRTEGDVYVAIDHGILVKSGQQILVSVRRAYSGVPLNELQQAVNQDFLKIDEQQREMRAVLAKLESGFLRRSLNLKNIY